MSGLAFGFIFQKLFIPGQDDNIRYLNTDSHFSDSGAEVIIYTTSWCDYCSRLKDYLSHRGIAYENRDIESGDVDIESLYQALSSDGVPLIVLRGKVISGFNIEQLDAEFNNYRYIHTLD